MSIATTREPLRSFRHVTIVTPSGRRGRMTLFIEHTKDAESGLVTWRAAPAFCSPKDSFRKAQGRAIAEARFNKNRPVFSGEGNFAGPQVLCGSFTSPSDSRSLAYVDTTEIALSVVRGSPLTPTWARRAYEQGDVYVGLGDRPVPFTDDAN